MFPFYGMLNQAVLALVQRFKTQLYSEKLIKYAKNVIYSPVDLPLTICRYIPNIILVIVLSAFETLSIAVDCITLRRVH